ncbi:MAG: NDP-hexose 2,3-dehydratase family protein [Clostridia bacterium]|nr:NDP-hexose 2,3-dehydratase family protein [Clostridia bacterium]
MSLTDKIVKSWAAKEGNVNSTADILEWIQERNATVEVDIQKDMLREDGFWYYNEADGVITNRNNSFFTISGMKKYEGDAVVHEQPVILQNEIGYLGIICREVGGALNFLMQAKIEPGNVNKIQLSPTIQATKSNFTQLHGGKKPPYLEYFINASKYEIVVDQIQSEQSSRFFKKRNRNIIIKVDEEIDILPTHRWMTLGQIKALMRYENIVNMDTRTVLSCIPFCIEKGDGCEEYFGDKALYNSIFTAKDTKIIPRMYQYINNIKMFDESFIRLAPLYSLKSWRMKDNEFVCEQKSDFKIIFCDISIEGREVRHWTQPLFEAIGMATFGLFTCIDCGIRKFLVRAKSEVGCFDKVELGPSVQLEPSVPIEDVQDVLTAQFCSLWRAGRGIVCDSILSEEGGRFYHEQNHNVIIEVQKDALELPEGAFWADYKTLNTLNLVNNCLNIQLRNLLSMLEVN